MDTAGNEIMQARYTHGYHHLTNPSKYLGNPCKIRYKSHLERGFMKGLDDNPDVVEWGYEYHKIKYQYNSETRTYLPDIYVVFNTARGLKKYMIEIKPHKDTVSPKTECDNDIIRKPIRTDRYNENQAKWNAARLFCLENSLEFLLITERDIFKKARLENVEKKAKNPSSAIKNTRLHKSPVKISSITKVPQKTKKPPILSTDGFSKLGRIKLKKYR